MTVLGVPTPWLSTGDNGDSLPVYPDSIESWHLPPFTQTGSNHHSLLIYLLTLFDSSWIWIEWALKRITFGHVRVCMGSLYHCIVACTDLGNSTGHRTVTLAALLLLISGLVWYEALLHSCGTSPVGGTDLWQCTLMTTFIVLPHCDISPPTPWPAIPLSLIILTLSQPVLPLF